MSVGLVVRIAAVMLGAMLVGPVPAADGGKKKGGGEDVKQDIANHRAMAEAHNNAAICLESGKPEKDCHAQLQKDCKGLAIGKYCGMKHAP